MAALAIFLRMFPGRLDEVDADEFALDLATTMPESMEEATDEVLERRDRKCLCGSTTGLRHSAGEPTLRASGCGFGLDAGISGASGTSNCLTSPLLILRETRSLETRKPSSVMSASEGKSVAMVDLAVTRIQCN